MLKQDAGQVRQVLLSHVRLSPENDELGYGPVRRDDPDVVALAAAIRDFGLKEALVLSLDNYIISGHRRYVAHQLLGRNRIPCRFENEWRIKPGEDEVNPEFVRLLREYNRQRVKTFSTMVREAVIDANPDDEYRAMVEHRRQVSKVTADTIVIEGETKRKKISEAKRPFLDAIKAVIRENEDFWPLTVRQIHYNLLNDPPLKHAGKPETYHIYSKKAKAQKLVSNRYVNDQDSYKSLCELLARARLCGEVPFDVIEDETRPVAVWNVFGHAKGFLDRQLAGLLTGYYRNLQQSQPNHIEIVGEKNTIEGVLRPVAADFCIPYTIGRGYSSLDPRKKMYERYRASGKEKLILLVLSDFDAEGENIPHSFARSMRDDFGIKKIEPVKVALTHEQVQQSAGLQPNKLKDSSSRAKWFRERYGEDTYELEAIPARQLQQYLRDAIDHVIDVDAFNVEVDREKEDAARLVVLRRCLLDAIQDAAQGFAE